MFSEGRCCSYNLKFTSLRQIHLNLFQIIYIYNCFIYYEILKVISRARSALSHLRIHYYTNFDDFEDECRHSLLSHVYILTRLSVTGCAKDFWFSAVFHFSEQMCKTDASTSNKNPATNVGGF